MTTTKELVMGTFDSIPDVLWIAYDPNDKKIWLEFTATTSEKAEKLKQLGFDMVEFVRAK